MGENYLDANGSTIWLLLCLALGAIALIHRWKSDHYRFSDSLPPWPIKLIDFLLILWALFMAVICFSFVIKGYQKPEEAIDALGWNGALAAWGTHLPIIFVFFTLRYILKTPILGEMSAAKLSIHKAFFQALYAFLWGIPLFLGVNILWKGILIGLQQIGLPIETSQQFYVSLFTDISSLPILILLVISIVVLAPISEEFVFRACIYRFLKTRTNKAYALVISALLFAFVHANLAAFLPLFLLGILFAYSYETSRDIKVPIFFHALFNLNSIVMITLESKEVISPFLILPLSLTIAQ